MSRAGGEIINTFWNAFLENIFEVISGALALAVSLATYFAYRGGTKIKELEGQIDRLKKTVLKTTSKVNPESNRLLINEAQRSIQILGINSLGPLHHCREELIQFLKSRKGVLHILLLNPKSPIFAQRAKREGDDVGRLSSEWHTSAAIIKDIAVKSSHPQNVYIRIHETEPTCALLIVDGLQKDESLRQMLINDYPSQIGKRGYEGGQFLVQYSVLRDRDSFDKRYSYFINLWTQGKAIPINQLNNS